MNHTKAGIATAVVAATFAVAVHAHDKSVKEQLGEVKFDVSCAAPAKAKFQRAMALYHSFDWRRGKSEFEEIATLDPRCGMAYWGLAMVHADNPFGWPVSMKVNEGAAAIQKAKEIGASTPRERDYIEALALLYRDAANTPHRARALAYEQAMEKLSAANPGDLEAKILYALALSANHDLNDKTYERPLKAAALLEPLFTSQPRHPGVAHYLIHSYDYPPIAHKGLAAAKRYSVVAADAAHAQHMPSHIFTRVGLWRESVASNKASAATDFGVKAQTPHAWDYMVYAYLQLGDDAAADAVWAEAGAIKPVTHQVGFGEAFGLAAIPARLALERGRWADAANVQRHTAYSDADWKRFPQAESLIFYARGLGAARSGNAPAARKGDRELACGARDAHGAQARLLGGADRDPGGRRHGLGAARRRQERRSPGSDAGRRRS